MPTWHICNIISDNIVIQLIWKFQESNWNPDWFIALMDSFDTYYIFTNNKKSWPIWPKCNAIPDNTMLQLSWKFGYRLVSNIRRTSIIRRTPTLGNSQLEFSPTISLAKTSNTRRTPSFDFWVSIVDKVRSRPTWSELLRVAWDFDSPWIKGPMTPYQSRPYARHVTVIPAAKLCDSIAIVFLSIEVRIWHNLRRYIDGSAILFWLSRDPYDPDDQDFTMRHDENYVE